MMKQVTIVAYLLTLFSMNVFGQSSFCPDDPPINSFLADSPYPIYHRNNYAQASSCLTGPLPGDSLVIKARTNISGGTSPWVYLSDIYPNGERVLLYSNSTHVFKFIDDGNEIVTIDSQRIDFDPIASFGWNFLLAKNKIWYTYDPKYDPDNNRTTRLFKLSDADINDPYSDIVILDTMDLGEYGINKVQHYSLNYSGQIVFNGEAIDSAAYAITGIIDPNFQLLDTLQYATFPNEIVHHNAFPIQEDNAYYIVTTHRLIKFAWDGINISLEWEALYDFVGDGPTGSFAEGSGTTPSLMGWGAGNDQLIVLADGHSNNHLLAFWRELPPAWTGIPGMDIHFADSISIPFAIASNNTFQSIENSPTIWGYEVAIAQFNGFLGYDCTNQKGVQKFSWDTLNNEFQLEWATDEVNMNGVLSYSDGSELVYGSGKEADCYYYYYGLDWNTGTVALKHLLGPEGTFLDDPFYDAGNNNIIDEAGNIYFPGGASLIKVESISNANNLMREDEPNVSLYPNPFTSIVRLEASAKFDTIELFNSNGQLLFRKDFNTQQELNLSDLVAGIYFLKISGKDTSVVKKIMKHHTP